MPQALGCEDKKFAVVRNPVQPFLHKLSCKPLADNSYLLTAYILGRNSPEKRHLDSIELLSTYSLVERIILVARDARNLREQLSPNANAKLLILECLTEINSFNISSSFLFSYSFVESYSLVIAEWLASGLTVLTVDNEPMRQLWLYARGCRFIPMKCTPAELEIALRGSFDAKNNDSRHFFEPITVQTSADDFEGLLTK
jgi:hypothetical protein